MQRTSAHPGSSCRQDCSVLLCVCAPRGPPLLPVAPGSVEGRFCFCQGCCGSEPPRLQPAVPSANGSADGLKAPVVARAGLDASLPLLRASLGRQRCVQEGKRGSKSWDSWAPRSALCPDPQLRALCPQHRPRRALGSTSASGLEAPGVPAGLCCHACLHQGAGMLASSPPAAKISFVSIKLGPSSSPKGSGRSSRFKQKKSESDISRDPGNVFSEAVGSVCCPMGDPARFRSSRAGIPAVLGTSQRRQLRTCSARRCSASRRVWRCS